MSFTRNDLHVTQVNASAELAVTKVWRRMRGCTLNCPVNGAPGSWRQLS